MANFGFQQLGIARASARRQSTISRAAPRKRKIGTASRRDGLEQLEPRRVMAFDFVTAFTRADQFLDDGATLREAPQQITLRFSPGTTIDPQSLGSISVVRSGRAGDAFGTGGSFADVDVVGGTARPGSYFVSVDDLPNQNQVTIRFAETLPDDDYTIHVSADPTTGLKTAGAGETLSQPVAFDLRLDLGAFVVAVVPQPITQTGVSGAGRLSQAADTVHVYFNANDPLDLASVGQAGRYGLYAVNAATGADASGPVNPTSVSYDAATGRAELVFAPGSIVAGTLYRLQVGEVSAPVTPPAPVVESSGDNAANSTFVGATALGALGAGGITVSGAITTIATVPTPAAPAPAGLPFPSQPGSVDSPGHRDTPADSGHHVDDEVTDGPNSGTTVQAYNFKSLYGTDPQGRPLYNQITEAQKQRAREIFSLYSRIAGISFVETESSGITVVTGDMRALSPGISTAPAGLAGGSMAIMDFTDTWNDEYGGSWFQVAMHEIGHVLGLPHSYDLPSIMGGGLTGEPVFPGNYDIEHVNQIYPAAGADIDVYSFSLATAGKLTAETFVARPGSAELSSLDTVLSLYRVVGGRRELVARNDDSFGRDSFIGLDLEAGDYFLAVTAAGNDDFNPEVENSGYGGRTEGAYQLQLGFVPVAAAADTVIDASGTKLDGDRDGVAGGHFSFWFVGTGDATTAYVDKAAPAGGTGSLASPYSEIDVALANLGGRTALRIVGNAAGEVANGAPTALPYLIGRSPQGATLEDGISFNVPAGVTAIIDSGAVFKLRDTVIDVGSSSQLVSRAGAALQVLGTPSSQVVFTSFHDDSYGRPASSTTRPGGDDGTGPAAAGGQWGGIVLREDSDSATKRVFLNTVGNALLRYGGGEVTVDSQRQLFTPIHLETTRPTLAFNRIEWSAGAAISADPNSFEESNGRAGPEVRGNQVIDNSINGLFLRIRTQAGEVLDKLDVAARFKSRDIAYVVAENLVVNGGAGGSLDVPAATLLADVTNGSLTVTVPSTAGLTSGMRVSGAGIPDDTRIFSASGTTVVLTRAATTGGFAVPLTFYRTEARPSGRLTIDPGVVVKLQGARIELERGRSQLVAEGLPGSGITFTSLDDNRFGAGGTFDTNGYNPDKFDATGTPIGVLTTGDWGGIVLNAGGSASIDRAYLAFGGGTTPIEGGFARFNVIEVQQGSLRLANSRVEYNANGLASGNRVGRQGNASATVFVRGAQPTIIGNDFRNNLGATISINANALDDSRHGDPGRTSGLIERVSAYDDNRGPLVRDNRLYYVIDPAVGRVAGGATLGMAVRGEEITVEGVWDDTDTVHVLQSEIVVNNFHTATGLRLMSAPAASLVVKLLGANAGFTASGEGADIDDRIGGTVQVIGQPGFPVVLTSLADDSVGASLDPLGFIVGDVNTNAAATTPAAGDWRSLEFQQLSNDRNVAVLRESESGVTGGIEANGSVSSAQALGTLAPNSPTGTNTWASAQEKSGDENRRLGFEVHGSVAFDTPTDMDVYTFTGYAGSEIWIDVDKTSPSLDAMVELLDAAGNVLARSADSLGDIAQTRNLTVGEASGTGTSRTYQLGPNVLPGTFSGTIYSGETAVQQFTVNAAGAFTFTTVGLPATRATGGTINFVTGQVTLTFNANPGTTELRDVALDSGALTAATLGLALPLTRDPQLGGDFYSTNPRDPGMRVILPGVTGQATQYFVRVRSQAVYATGAGGTSTATYETGLRSTGAGATSGGYELRIRTRQRDEKPGSTVRYADIRFPTIGIDVIGLPRNSPLVGETAESTTANDSLATAQQLDNLLQIDRNTISLAGTTDNANDVDWYSFTVDYDKIQSIGGINNGGKTWSTVFDLDYSAADLTLSVFDASGRLLYVGRNSNIADDQPGAGQGNDFDDLSRGSQSGVDAFIGPVQLPAGVPGSTTRYYVAVSSNERLPTALDATFKSGATNSLIRLEPVNSVTRVVEDHIGSTGYTSGGAQVDPTTGPIIDISSREQLAANVRPFTLADVVLYVSTGSGLFTADAFKGGIETTVAINGTYTNGSVGDIDMRTDGRLFQYFGANNDGANNGLLREINPGTGAIISSVGDGIADDPATPDASSAWKVTGQSVDAVAIRRRNPGDYTDGVVYSIRDAGSSFLYTTFGAGTVDFNGTAPDSTRTQMTGGATGRTGFLTGLQHRNENGTLYGITTTGQFFDTGSTGFLADFSGVLNGGETFQGLATGPVNLEAGRYAGLFFAITNQGRLVCINPATGTLVDNVFDTDLVPDGIGDSPVSLATVNGATGLAFSPLDVNLWHPTRRRGDVPTDPVGAADPGHGINVPLDDTRNSTGTPGGTSMYFGLEEYSTNPAYGVLGGNGQYGVYGSTWQQDLTAGAIGDNYDLPGGAYGSLITNPFSLAGSTAGDLPTLYFNYFLDTQGASSKSNTMRDSARVFVSTDDGLTWQVVATNNSARSTLDTEDAELPNTPTALASAGTLPNQVVQELFDSTGGWRQARIDLSPFAGASNVRLRFDFSTAGKFDEDDISTATPDATRRTTAAATASTTLALDAVSGLEVGMLVQIADNAAPGTPLPVITAIDATLGTITLDTAVNATNGLELGFFRPNQPLKNDIAGLANTTGNFGTAERGQNNDFEGFYVDDIMVGFAERGEMITGATAGQTAFYNLATPNSDTYPAQVPTGTYQLEIRRGTEYGEQPDASSPNVRIFQTFDTNDRMIAAAAAPALVLAQNVLGAPSATVAEVVGSTGAVTWGGTDVSLAADPTATAPQQSAVSWDVNLAGQTSAFLRVEYQTGTRETLSKLPATFILDNDNTLPSGDGIAVSTDGGTTWTTIASFSATNGEWKTLSLDLVASGITPNATTVVGFFQSGQRDTAANGGIGLRNAVITATPPVATSGLVGDSNHPREQGQFLVENNIIASAAQYGIRIDAGPRDPGSNTPHPGATGNFPTANPTRQVPGAVVVNNIIAESGTAGILFSGDPNAAGAPAAALPYGRIVNNTINGALSGRVGSGIVVTDNAVPTILNNILANVVTGVSVQGATALAGTVVGYNGYYNATTQVSAGIAQTSPITLTADPFVNPSAGNYYLNPQSKAIDSSIDTLQDRAGVVSYKQTLGISPSPILAPQYDLYGQLRADDPSAATSASGLGFNVFKDLGAIDRVDFTKPSIALADPLDGATADTDPAANAVRLEREDARSVRSFSLQLSDVGVGIDPSTVVAEAFTLSRNGTPLTEGTEYLFRYYATSNRVVFESASAFAFADYTISVMSRQASSGTAGWLTDLANNTVLPTNADGSTVFTIVLVDVPSAPTGVTAAAGDARIDVAWSEPADNNSPILQYEVDVREFGSATWTTVATPTASPATVTTGIVNGTRYYVRVRAINAVGAGAYSTEVGPVVPLAAPALALADDTGASTVDGFTRVGTVDVTGVLTGATWSWSTDGTTWTTEAGTSFTLPEGVYAAGTVLVRQSLFGADGPAGSNPIDWSIDTTAPLGPGLSLGTGVDNGATATEAEQASGVVTVTGEVGAEIVVVFTDGTNTVTKTVTGTGAAQPVVLLAAEVATLADGTVTVTATQTDAAGNPQTDSAATTSFTLDRIAPVAPGLAIGPAVSGIVSVGEATAASGVVTATGEAGATIVVVFTGPSGSVTKTVTGTGSAQPVVLDVADVAALGNGAVNVAATQSDAAGNPQTASPATTSFTLDTIAPATPGMAYGPGVANGASATEAVQAAGIVTVSGEVGATITVVFTGPSGSVTKTVTGTGAFQPVVLLAADVATLGNGVVNVAATQTDAAGNPQTTPANIANLILDTVAPTTPGMAYGAGVANGATLAEAAAGIVTVTGEPGATIVVVFSRGANTVTKTLTGTGAAQPVVLSAADVAALGDGVVNVAATQTDRAGNPQTAPANVANLVLDTTAPAAPLLALGAGVANGATLTEATQASGVVTVTGEAGAAIVVVFSRGGTSITKTLTGAGSAQPVVLSSADVSALGNGAVNVAATQTDLAGNPQTVPAATTSFTIDTVAPARPGLAYGAGIADGTTLAEATQASGIVTVAGEAGAAIAVVFTGPSGSVTKTVTGTGATQPVVLSAADVATLGNGVVNVAATQTDAAGNPQTTPANIANLILDTVAPARPGMAYGAGVANGASAVEATQASGIVTVAGEPGAAVSVVFTGPAGSVTKTVTGTGAMQPVVLSAADAARLGDGVVNVAARQTDRAGNPQTAAATVANLVLDTTAPARPGMAYGAGVGNGATLAEATQASGIVSVSGEPGAVISVVFTGPTGSVTKSLAGTGAAQAVVLSAADVTALGNGVVNVAATQTDRAGNVQTAPATVANVILDTVAPVAPVVAIGTGIADGATLAEATQGSGAVTVTGERGAAIAVVFTGTAGIVRKTVTGTGSAQAVVLSAADVATLGNGTVRVAASQIDVAGNAGPAASATFVVDSVVATLVRLDSTVANGTYRIGATIPLVATLSEAVRAGAAIEVTLNTGKSVTLVAAAAGSTLTGSYVVAPGEMAADLDVVACRVTGTLVDLAGNATSSVALPGPAGQLAALKNIVIDGTIRVTTSTSFSIDPNVIPDRRTAVTAIPITFNAPVTGVSLSAFRLLYNGRSLSLRGAVVMGSGSNYTLRLPVALTTPKGFYTLQILPTSTIRAAENSAPLTETLQIFWGNGRSKGVTVTARALAFRGF